MTTKECEASNSEHPEEQHPLISSEHSPGLLPKVLGQVFLIFAKLFLWLLKKFQDQQNIQMISCWWRKTEVCPFQTSNFEC